MKPLRVLSLFDGISCGQVALERAGIPVEVYYASEIDKYAIQITQKNYPNTIQLGDVEKIDFTQYEGKIDLLIGGSPCTNLSICGNRKGLEGNESRLFWEYVRAIKECKPKYFLLENVESMTDSDREIISKELGCYPIMINSSLVSAQNRKRYYWFNWGLMQYNLFGFPTCDIPQPKNKGILLKDVLESGIADRQKCGCLTANDWKGNGANPLEYMSKHQPKPYVAESVIYQLPRGYNDGGIKKDKSPALTTSQWQYNNLLVNKEPVRLSQYEKSKGQAQRVYSVKGKSVVLNANGGGQGGKTGLYKIDLPDGEYLIRKLTPLECERLQTLPDNYTDCGVSYYYYNIYDIINMVIKGEQLCKNVKLKDVKILSQTEKQGYAINIIYDISDMEQQNLQEILLNEKKSVLLMDVITSNKQERDIVLNTIKDLKEQEQQNLIKMNLKNVNIAVDWQLQEECVIGTIKIGYDTEMQNIQIKLEKEQIITDIKNLKENIEYNIEKLPQKYWGEIYHLKKLYTILIWINLIMIKKIYMYVIKINTQAYISNLIELQGNSLKLELSNLKMADIIPISATQRYKAIGNGWTVDVIAHIFSFLKEELESED